MRWRPVASACVPSACDGVWRGAARGHGPRLPPCLPLRHHVERPVDDRDRRRHLHASRGGRGGLRGGGRRRDDQRACVRRRCGRGGVGKRGVARRRERPHPPPRLEHGARVPHRRGCLRVHARRRGRRWRRGRRGRRRRRRGQRLCFGGPREAVRRLALYRGSTGQRCQGARPPRRPRRGRGGASGVRCGERLRRPRLPRQGLGVRRDGRPPRRRVLRARQLPARRCTARRLAGGRHPVLAHRQARQTRAAAAPPRGALRL
mmetsp:Transcript_11421/g.37408  ORF Transcript_11421/g.37408 Transcript_11421/m.37408 type:complete len:261 (-) Transcript_11421:137-919(-)